MTKTAVINDQMTPAGLAQMSLEQCENITADATDLALRWMDQNPDWVSAHLLDMQRRWISYHIHLEHKNSQRRPVPIHADVIPFRPDLAETAQRNFSRMMDAPLWGGKRIGDATPAEIRASASAFELQGATMLRRARWQNLVAETAEKNGCAINESVSSALPPQKFDQLWETVDGE